MIVKKFDILWELPKDDIVMEWENAVGKMVPIGFLYLLEKPLIKKKKVLSANFNKTRCACISKASNKETDSKIKGS